jgi:hypothetical protein
MHRIENARIGGYLTLPFVINGTRDEQSFLLLKAINGLHG